MIVWSLKLSSNQIKVMRKIADAETEGTEFVGASKWLGTFKSLIDGGLVDATEQKRPKSSIGGTPAKYKLTGLGVAILSAVDVELKEIQ